MHALRAVSKYHANEGSLLVDLSSPEIEPQQQLLSRKAATASLVNDLTTLASTMKTQLRQKGAPRTLGEKGKVLVGSVRMGGSGTGVHSSRGALPLGVCRGPQRYGCSFVVMLNYFITFALIY